MNRGVLPSRSGSWHEALVALAACATLAAPSPARAQAAPSAQLEAEVLVPPQGGAAEVPLHVGKVCVLAFPDKLDHRAIISSSDFGLAKWSENTLAVRATRDTAAPATIALATTAGLKVNVTLRVVPATEPAPAMVRFRALSEAQLLEARVTAEVAKHLAPAQHQLGEAQHRLEHAQHRLEQAQRQLASAQGQLTEERQHLIELTRRREPETTLALQLTRGSAVLWDAGTEASAEVESRGVAASVSFGVRHWLHFGGELGVAYLDEASHRRATLPIAGNMFTGRLRRTTNTAQLRGFATLRVGYLWTPFLQLALGAGARFRSTALLYVPTAQGLLWLPPDDQGKELSLDLVTGVRAGIERRVTVRWTAGVSAAAAHAFGVSTPDLRTSEITFSLSYAPFGP